MAVTISVDSDNKAERISQNYGILTGTMSFPSSYAAGGEDVSGLATAGIADYFKTLLSLEVGSGGVMGYSFNLDATKDSEKLKVYANAPAIVFEEKHTASSKAVTLDYPAAWLINVCKAGQGMQWIETGTTAPGANEFCLTTAIADGVRTKLTTAGASDVIYVTYVTQAWQELYSLLIQEEPLTLPSGPLTVANKILAFGYVYDATDGHLIPMDIADTTEDQAVGVKFNFATGGLDFNATASGQTAKFTYLKVPASGFILDRFVVDEDATNTTGVNTLDFPLLLWLNHGYVTADTVNAGEQIILSEDDPGAGECAIVWHNAPAGALASAPITGFTIGCNDSVTVTAAAYLKGRPSEVTNLAQLEVKDGSNLSKLVVRYTAIGYKGE